MGGFTLVEVMVTLALAAILLSMIGSILVSFLTTQKKVEATLLRERVGAAILDLIARNLQGVYAYELQGSFKGTDERTGAGEADKVEFVTTRDPSVRDEGGGTGSGSGGQDGTSTRLRADSIGNPNAGALDAQAAAVRQPPQLTKVTYSARDSRSNPKLLTVFRSEVRYIPPPPAQLGAVAAAGTTAQQQQSLAASTGQDLEERFMEVYDRVKSFNVRYLRVDRQQKTTEWRDTWDIQDEIPAAVEISVEIATDPRGAQGEGEERARKIYRTLVAVPTTLPSPQQQQPGGSALGGAAGVQPK